MTDQCVASASNFAVTVAVARVAGAAGLGAFALAYAAWVAVNSIHRALITDPMAIHNDARSPDPLMRYRQGIAAELVLGLAATIGFAVVGGILFFAGQRNYGIGLLALAPWVTFLDIQDYWRWIGFMQGKPGKALANDLIFDCVQGVSIVVVILTSLHSSAAMIAAWGFGAIAGSFFGFWQFSVHPTTRGGAALLRERWHMSKWLLGNAVTSSGTSQLTWVAAASILGSAGLGGLKATTALVMGPSAVVIHASGSLGLPEASRALEERGWSGLRRVAWLMTGAALVSVGSFGVAIIVAGGELLRIVYGPAFAQYAPAAQFIAIGYVVSAIGIGPILVLKATKQTRGLLNAQFVNLAVSIPLIVVLGWAYGVTGAGASFLCSAGPSIGILLIYQRKARRTLPNNLPSSILPSTVALADELLS